MSDDSSNLPDNWITVSVGDILKVRSGYSFKSSDYCAQGVPVIRQSDIGDDIVDTTQAKKVSPKFLSTLPEFVVKEGDLLIGMSGSLGKIARYDDPQPSLQNQRTGLLRIHPDVSTSYAKFVLKFVEPQILAEAKGIAVQNVSAKEIEGCRFPLAPLPEQKRIVAEIEKQFTRLEAGVAALRRAQTSLKRYRAAVLKSACEGRLVPTEAELACKERRPYESAERLLERILAERRAKWTGKGKYKEPAVPDTINLPTLPEGWTWVSWEMVLAHEEGAFKRGPFGSALTKSIFVEKGFKVYEQYCPINDDCSFARYYITPEKFEELQAFEVRAGDYLISCSGVTLGRITRVPERFERGIINQALLRVRINDSALNHRYFLHLFRSALFQRAIFDNSTGSAIPNVKGVKELKAMAIPLPPLLEQKRIVAEVERRLSVVDELATMVAANLKRAERLRQAILKRAFEGKLVPQDPKDEPAKRLLERIALLRRNRE
jgi:type I restriction enzyme S subunit